MVVTGEGGPAGGKAQLRLTINPLKIALPFVPQWVFEKSTVVPPVPGDTQPGGGVKPPSVTPPSTGSEDTGKGNSVTVTKRGNKNAIARTGADGTLLLLAGGFALAGALGAVMLRRRK